MSEQRLVSVSEVELESEPNRGNMVILKEGPGAPRFFMMFIGDAEFAAIAKEKGLVQPKRPLTHELYLGILDKLDLRMLRVEIHDMREETFYAKVVISVGGEEHAVDSRPSDAVALALNRKIPILVREDLFRRKLSTKEISEYEDLVKTIRF